MARQGTASDVILYWEAQNEPTELINTFRLTELFFTGKLLLDQSLLEKLLSCSRVFSRVVTKINRKNKINRV